MASLIETDPFGTLLPVAAAGCRLEAAPPGPVTAIAPFRGRAAAVSEALAPLGLSFPGPGRSAAAGEARILWAGRELAFLAGVAAPAALEGLAALVDQSDGWAVMALTGARHAEVLARLVPVDLRPAAFPPGAAIRAPVNQMPALLTRTGPETVEIWVFRSMAATAVHEIGAAMRALAAREAAAAAS